MSWGGWLPLNLLIFGFLRLLPAPQSRRGEVKTRKKGGFMT